jgi:hypothetical protein
MESLNQVYKSVQWINTLFDTKERPKYLLDPLTTVIKLSMLQYKSSKTKIRIANNKIAFSEASFFQGINRWMGGDSRSNIHYLYLPILYFCYLKYECQHSTENIPHNFSVVVEIFNKLVIDGLQELKKTYLDSQNDLVINCLDLYLLMLSSEDEPSIRQRYDKMNVTTKNTYEEFLKCWRPKNIEIIKELFDELDKENKNAIFVEKTLEMIDSYLDAINHSIDRLREP